MQIKKEKKILGASCEKCFYNAFGECICIYLIHKEDARTNLNNFRAAAHTLLIFLIYLIVNDKNSMRET